MNRLVVAATLSTALVAPFTPMLPERTADAAPVGRCTPKSMPHLLTTGTWTRTSVTLSGPTRIRRWGRDRRTTVYVQGVATFRDVGAAQRRYVGMWLTTAPTATAVTDIGWGSRHTCTFRLGRAS